MRLILRKHCIKIYREQKCFNYPHTQVKPTWEFYARAIRVNSCSGKWNSFQTVWWLIWLILIISLNGGLSGRENSLLFNVAQYTIIKKSNQNGHFLSHLNHIYVYICTASHIIAHCLLGKCNWEKNRNLSQFLIFLLLSTKLPFEDRESFVLESALQENARKPKPIDAVWSHCRTTYSLNIFIFIWNQLNLKCVTCSFPEAYQTFLSLDEASAV